MSASASASQDDLHKQFLKLAKELIVHHGIDHRTIVKDIHNVITEEASRLPKIQVLYNAVHGGFGLSKVFERFVRESTDEKIDSEYVFNTGSIRVKGVACIVPFGAQQLSNYPIIRDMLFLYEHYKIDKAVLLAQSLYYHKSSIKRLEKRRTQLEMYLNNSYYQGNKTVKDYDNTDGDSDDDNTCLTLFGIINYTSSDIKGYTKQTYEKALQKINDEITSKNESVTEERVSKSMNFNIPTEIYQDLENIICQMMEDEASDRYTYLISSNVRDKYSFIESLSAFGETDAKVWKCQSRFVENAMKYLLIKKNDCEYLFETEDRNVVYDFVVSKSLIHISSQVHDKIINEFGLACASSQYCKLEIGQVPQYVDWWIGEYDGLEKVCML